MPSLRLFDCNTQEVKSPTRLLVTPIDRAAIRACDVGARCPAGSQLHVVRCPNYRVLIVTYAGFIGEADLLESIYKRGMDSRRIDDELECYENDELFMFGRTRRAVVADGKLLRAAAKDIKARAVSTPAPR